MFKSKPLAVAVAVTFATPLSLIAVSAGAAVLEETVVTAQKREQSIQDVGIAITAYTGDQLDQLGFTNAQQVTAMAPGVQTIQDLKSSVVIRSISDELDQLMQKSLQPLQSKDFTLSIYFGHNLAKRYDRLSLKLFALFQAPLMRAQFTWSLRQKKWLLQSIAPVAVSDVPAEHRDFLLDAATKYFSGRQTWPKNRKRPTAVL